MRLGEQLETARSYNVYAFSVFREARFGNRQVVLVADSEVPPARPTCTSTQTKGLSQVALLQDAILQSIYSP
jgi:hypothetical protein